MIPDQIEHNVLVEAPIETVWKVVTQPEHIAQWFSSAAEVNPLPGSKSTLTFGDPSSSDAKIQPFFVETYEPTTRFSFRWCHQDSDLPDTKSLLVEFNLSTEGDKTRLQMIESSHTARSSQEMFDEHVDGWNAIIPRLVDHIITQS